MRTASFAMALTTWFVILPLSLASLATGLVQATGTAWGLFRHYWVLFKLLLTTIATLVLLLKLAPIVFLADAAAAPAFSGTDLLGLRTSLLVHATGALLVLLAAVVLAVYKPRGMTPYGMRKLRGRVETGNSSWLMVGTGTPRWVKVFGVIVVVLILLVGAMMLGGGHGPDAHNPGGLGQ